MTAYFGGGSPVRIRIAGCLILLLIFAGVFVTGCGSSSGDGNGELSGSITIAGSTSVQPFSEVLAEEFMAQNPDTKVNVQGGGSTQGIEATREGVADIGASSREIKPEEKLPYQYLIARDGIIVVVHPSNKVNNLTLDQVKAIFTGNIRNWKDVGGKDGEITLVSREAGSGTRDGFETLAMDKESISNRALIANSTGAIRMIVAGDRNAVGYISLAVLDYTVKPVRVDGIDPTSENIRNNRYPINRPFIYVTNSEPTGLVQEFIDFVLSEQGQSILEEEGAIRVRVSGTD